MRGGSAWRAGADVVLSAIADRDEQTGKVSRRKLALAKACDGIEGTIAAFDLSFVQLGTDQDGDPFGSLIVEPRFGETPIAKREREPGTLRTFRATFNEALDTVGQTIRIRGDGRTVRAVDVADLRAEFCRSHATGEEDQAKRKEAQRKAFGRALERLDRQFPRCVMEGKEWIWSATSDAQPDRAGKLDISDMS